MEPTLWLRQWRKVPLRIQFGVYDFGAAGPELVSGGGRGMLLLSGINTPIVPSRGHFLLLLLLVCGAIVTGYSLE